MNSAPDQCSPFRYPPYVRADARVHLSARLQPPLIPAWPNLVQLQNQSPVQKRARIASKSSVWFECRVRIQPHECKSDFALSSAMPSGSVRFTLLQCLSASCLSASRPIILPHVDQRLAHIPGFAGGYATRIRYCPTRAIESRSHLPMSAAPVLMSDRTQRNVRAPFQDTQRFPPGNFDLTFG